MLYLLAFHEVPLRAMFLEVPPKKHIQPNITCHYPISKDIIPPNIKAFRRYLYKALKSHSPSLDEEAELTQQCDQEEAKASGCHGNKVTRGQLPGERRLHVIILTCTRPSANIRIGVLKLQL